MFHNFQTKYFCKSLFYSTQAEILLVDRCAWEGNTSVKWVPEGRYFLVEFEEDSSNNHEYIFELTTALFLLIAEKGNKEEWPVSCFTQDWGISPDSELWVLKGLSL